MPFGLLGLGKFYIYFIIEMLFQRLGIVNEKGRLSQDMLRRPCRPEAMWVSAPVAPEIRRMLGFREKDLMMSSPGKFESASYEGLSSTFSTPRRCPRVRRSGTWRA